MSITPVPPEVRDELHRLLAQAPKVIGCVARGDTDGISHRDLGYARLDIAQILGDQPTTYPWRAYPQLTKLERMRASEGISDGLAAYLDEEIPQLAELARKYRPVRDEARARKESRDAQLRNDPGVYVFALPHYLRHPYDEDTGNTLLKVGMSGGVVGRFLGQTRTTALPEDPILLRVYRRRIPARKRSGSTACSRQLDRRVRVVARLDVNGSSPALHTLMR